MGVNADTAISLLLSVSSSSSPSSTGSPIAFLVFVFSLEFEEGGEKKISLFASIR
jgi:hypothetical protein